MAQFTELSLLVQKHTSGKLISLHVYGGSIFIDKTQLAEIIKEARLKVYSVNRYSFGKSIHYTFKPKS